MKWFREQDGQALVEYLIVVAIIVAVILLNEPMVCSINRVYIHSSYKLYLTINKKMDSDKAFGKFMLENNFDLENYTRIDGRIHCRKHHSNQPIEEPDPETVPWL